MNETQIYETLTDIFRDLFDDEEIVLGPTTTAADVAGWDSNAHINIMASAEVKFGVKFTTSEIESLKSVGDLARLIQKKRKS